MARWGWMIVMVLALAGCGQQSRAGGPAPAQPGAPATAPQQATEPLSAPPAPGDAAIMASLGVPAPPDGVPYAPGSLEAQYPGLDAYIETINSAFIDGMPYDKQELAGQAVYVSQQSPAELRAFYEAALRPGGWELVQASDEPNRIRELLIYQRRDADAGYALYLNLTSNPQYPQDPNSYVFVIIGRALQ